MNHRSLVFGLFGDYVRHDGGAIDLRDLAAVAAPFGVGPDALRVVMSRLRREGWFEACRSGGRARYTATTQTWHLLDEGNRRLSEPAREPWSGEWHIVIYEVPETERGVRDQLRKRLAWSGFGPLAASTWLNPHDRVGPVLDWAGGQPTVRIDTLIARSRDVEQDRRYASRCWDLRQIQDDHSVFLDRFGSPESTARWRAAAGVDALVERVRLTHDYRRLLLRDPGLPTHLLPGVWPADRTAALYQEADSHLGPEAVSAYRSLVHTLAGSPRPLPV